MSERAWNCAWRCRGLTLALSCTLLALAEHADEGGRCWPSLTRLAALTEADRRTVTRGLAELEARGLVARECRWGKGTVYTLAIAEPSGTATPPGSPDPGGRGVTPQGVTDSRAKGGSPRQQGREAPRSRGVRPPEPS